VKLLSIPPQYLKKQLIPNQHSAGDTRIPNQRHYGFCSCIWPIKKSLPGPCTMKRDVAYQIPYEWKIPTGRWGGGEVREGHYYDERGYNYLQPLVVCIGCKAFIRRIKQQHALRFIYCSLIATPTPFMFTRVDTMHYSMYAWTYASIIRPNIRINYCTYTQRFWLLLQRRYPYALRAVAYLKHHCS
jgi:hypothetical protein